MKNIFIGLIAVWGLFLVSCETREPMAEVIERGLEVSKRQAVFLAKEVENQKGRLPRTYEALEPMLSRNIIKLQITDNHILSKAQSKSKSF